jgi:hypothetical protein
MLKSICSDGAAGLQDSWSINPCAIVPKCLLFEMSLKVDNQPGVAVATATEYARRPHTDRRSDSLAVGDRLVISSQRFRNLYSSTIGR